MHADDTPIITTERLVKRFGSTTALDHVDLSIPRGRVVGLIGRNGSGKTTLLRSFLGLDLPTSGKVRVLGSASADLGARELSRVGAVFQESRFLPWMTGQQHLAFVASFSDAWDREREYRLRSVLELDVQHRIGSMSPGNVQKLAIVTAACHHPEVLLLDEPAADLDPVAREALLASVLDIVAEDSPTIVISSHALRDIERIADWITCLDHGHVVQDAALDDIQERHAQWILTARDHSLPPKFDEPWIRSQRVDRGRAELLVRDPPMSAEDFGASHGAEVEARGLELERAFPMWLRGQRT